jgi:hypothetical protein
MYFAVEREWERERRKIVKWKDDVSRQRSLCFYVVLLYEMPYMTGEIQDISKGWKFSKNIDSKMLS